MKIKSCEFNQDTACVEIKYADGAMLAIDIIQVENDVARNRFEIRELDYLIYHAPLEYAELVLSGNVEQYLRKHTVYRLELL